MLMPLMLFASMPSPRGRGGSDLSASYVLNRPSWLASTESVGLKERRVSADLLQGWVAVLGALAAAVLGLFKYFNYRSKKDRVAEVGAAFASTVEALASENQTSRMAGAVLLRRFFDRHTEQGAVGRPYVKEAIEVMAGMLREEQPQHVQKVLADGLRYARELQGADLQNCDLTNAYIGRKSGDESAADLSKADLYGAKCDRASFKETRACETVFMNALLTKAVFIDADCTGADFRYSRMEGAKFGGARIGGARFAEADGIPQEVAALLDANGVGRPGAVVPKPPTA